MYLIKYLNQYFLSYLNVYAKPQRIRVGFIKIKVYYVILDIVPINYRPFLQIIYADRLIFITKMFKNYNSITIHQIILSVESKITQKLIIRILILNSAMSKFQKKLSTK